MEGILSFIQPHNWTVNETLELFSVLLSLLFISGIALKKLWAWPLGIIASSIAVVLFYRLNLFSESILNIFYVVLGFYGWWRWKRIARDYEDSANDGISEIPPMYHALILSIGFFLVAVVGWYFSGYTRASLPYLDALTTVFGMIATLLEARKIRSCWYYWVVINGLSIALYLLKDLQLYSALAVVFTLLSVWGWWSWRAQNARS